MAVSLPLIEPSKGQTPLHVVVSGDYENWLAGRSESHQAWLKGIGYEGESGKAVVLPGTNGVDLAVISISEERALWDYAAAAEALPFGDFTLAEDMDANACEAAALGWALASYVFERYKKRKRPPPRLAWPVACDRARVIATVNAMFLVRDLINTPAADLGPNELANAAQEVAETFGANFEVTIGEELLAANYPMIHAVGRASCRPPRLIDIVWGVAADPKVTLVGKGVCFDSGGLNLKPGSAMAWMKKDMGGAAVVLGLAYMIMALELPIRLRVMIPAVENVVSGNAFRPGDVLTARSGATVEIGNTDAEGRLVMADALTDAVGEMPELLIDCATLTGAARVALGAEIAGFFTDDDALAAEIQTAAANTYDPVWRLPLWQPYREHLESGIADINNAGEGRFGGAITAALFLQNFAAAANSWVHFDMYAWNSKSLPGRPKGGEGQLVRALFQLIEVRYSP